MTLSSKNFSNLSGNRILLSLPFETRLYLKGKVQIDAILSNEILIYGGTFGIESKFPLEVYSPRGYSLLYIEACKCAEKYVTANLSKFNKQDDTIIQNVLNSSESCTVIVLSRLNTPWTGNVENMLKFSDSKRQKMALFGREKWRKDNQIVPEKVEEILDISFVAPIEFNEVRVRYVTHCEQLSLLGMR